MSSIAIRALPFAPLLVTALSQPLVSQRTISFQSTDGGVVSADDYGAGPIAIVLAPGGAFTKESWRAQATELVAAGYRVMAIDFRGRGASRPGAGGLDRLDADVLGAIRELRRTGAKRVVLVGASLGGGAAADAAIAAPGEVDGVVLLASSRIERPERLPPNSLFLVGRGDTTAAGVPRLVRIRDEAARVPTPSALVILEDPAHAQHLFATGEGPRVMRAIVDFLGRIPR